MPDEIIIDHTTPPADDHALHIDHSPHPKQEPKPSNGSSPKPAASHESASPLPAMQTVVQINVYRERGNQFEFLLLKRIDHDDKFWQPVTEPVKASSTIADTLRQAAIEQIGISGFKHLNKEMHSYEWYAHGQRGRDIVFAAELSLTAVITPDLTRFSTYEWYTADQAVQQLKWNGNKEAIQTLNKHLVANRRAHPLPLTTGLYEAPAQLDAATQPQPNANTKAQPVTPVTPNNPDRPSHPTNHRLPDVPSTTTDTSALFL